ncbi:F-box protein At2g32560-like [Curcuma longa]|uniref:F-box protein At2g32560-like n=1 Tax=Curcuma longa TaxID=136217 RepID=UPI003D9DD991
MLSFLMSFFPFVFFLSKSFPLLRWGELLSRLLPFLEKCKPIGARKIGALPQPQPMIPRNKCSGQRVENVEEPVETSLLDLPELALECVLEKLPPAGLSAMAAVCSSLRERCRSDHFWEKHMREKWGSVIGPAETGEWKHHLASLRDSSGGGVDCEHWIGLLPCIWPISWLTSRIANGNKLKNSLLADSVMAWYQSLESGQFWFPAQVYNREHGHVGFMLSCYDAQVRYDCRTDTFLARYPPHGRRTVVTEEGVEWKRLRAPPASTSAHELHISDCLSKLRPRDHVEIQWRKNKEFPYGWWYGVIGHLQSCDGNEHFCHCHLSNTIVLEFNQYTPGSRWRQASIDRKNHREVGNETDGFYGGIRKLESKDEISKWRELWPTDALE